MATWTFFLVEDDVICTTRDIRLPHKKFKTQTAQVKKSWTRRLSAS